MAKTRKCRPCKARTCSKRKGSPRFTDTCKKKFRVCQKASSKEGLTLKEMGTKCMTELQRCAGHRSQKAAVRKYKRARA